MKATYTTPDGRLTVEFEVSTQAELFEELADFTEIFDDRICRKNGETSENTRFVVRMDDDENKYYELVCFDQDNPNLRYAKKRFGVKKKGGKLFPKPLQADGKTVYENGSPVYWIKYDSATKTEK